MINIVLYEPEIPQNTGNIMRTAMASGVRLHLIEPLGFKLNEKTIKRAGMDYIKKLDYTIYEDYDDFKSKNKGEFFYVTRYGNKPISDFNFSNLDRDIYLVFGKESTGIPKDILYENIDRCFRIPMIKDARSLNLSNCVSICVYEVLRQRNYEGLSFVEVIKGDDFLDKNH